MKKILCVLSVCLLAAGVAQASVVLLNNDFSSGSTANGQLQVQHNETPTATNGTWRGNGNWTIGSGAMSLSGDAAGGEGGIGRLIDLSGITDTSLDQLTLSMSFTTTANAESLYVFLRGFAGGTPPATRSIFNEDASNGNAWDETTTTIPTKVNLNLGVAFNGTTGTGAGNAVKVSDGVAGLHNFSQTFDMSGYTLSDITQYDYLAVIITRDGTGNPDGVSIDSINVTAIPEPATLGLIAMVGTAILFVRRRLVL